VARVFSRYIFYVVGRPPELATTAVKRDARIVLSFASTRPLLRLLATTDARVTFLAVVNRWMEAGKLGQLIYYIHGALKRSYAEVAKRAELVRL
jgi:hypothetical protein